MSLRIFTSPVAAGLSTIAFSVLGFTASAHAGGDPRGVWYDHNGRGAVEIKECASNAKRLCGHVVYVKKGRNKKRCGMQIIGNVKNNGRGWIYSPKRGRSYPLALKKLSNNRLRIVGNAGSFFTKTYTWKRAPESIVNCEQALAARAKTKPEPQPVATTPKPTKVITSSISPKEATPRYERETGNASSATAALLAAPVVAAATAPEPQPVATQATTPTTNAKGGDDLSPPGGLSKGGNDKLAKLESVIKKFTGGKGLKGFKSKGNGRKCKFRIPYVGRTIKVPCK